MRLRTPSWLSTRTLAHLIETFSYERVLIGVQIDVVAERFIG